MTRRVAITRALPEAESTAERVRACGGEPVLAPLLKIVPCAYDTSIDGAQALVFTSTNGVRAFPDVRAQRALKVLAVGDATAEAARSAGFIDVRSANGDVKALAELARTTLDPLAGKLIHIGGEHLAGDLSGLLMAAGFEVERRIGYAAIAVQELPEAFRKPLDIVLFHSTRAVQTFLDLNAPGCQGLTAGCLSDAIATIARKGAWKTVIVASRPRENDLLAATLPHENSPAGASA